MFKTLLDEQNAHRFLTGKNPAIYIWGKLQLTTSLRIILFPNGRKMEPLKYLHV